MWVSLIWTNPDPLNKGSISTHLILIQASRIFSLCSFLSSLSKLHSIPVDESPLSFKLRREFTGWGSRSLLHKERCCISLGIKFITASKQESRANRIEGIPTLSSTLSHTHKHTHAHTYTADKQEAQSKQKLREMIQETKGYIKDSDTMWLLIIVHFKMTHYCVSGKNGSRLATVKQAYFFSLNNRPIPSLQAWIPERLSMWVVSVSSWSEVQGSVWINGHPRVHFGDGC